MTPANMGGDGLEKDAARGFFYLRHLLVTKFNDRGRLIAGDLSLGPIVYRFYLKGTRLRRSSRTQMPKGSCAK